jgi:hypothetical protein
VRTDEELSEAFDRLPEKGKHFIALIRSEFADLRQRVQDLEREVARLKGE